MQKLKGWGEWTLAMGGAALVALVLFIPPTIAQQPSTLSGTDQSLVPTKPGPPPKAVFKEMKYAFGEIQRGESISHIFIVKNEGEGPLAISNVQPG